VTALVWGAVWGALAYAQEAESALFLSDSGTGEGAQNAVSGGTSVFPILRILLVLALVTAAVYGIVSILKKAGGRQTAADPWLKVLAAKAINPRASAAVIAVGGKAYLVGASENAVSLIAEITDKETVDAMLLDESRRSAQAGGGFGALLRRFGIQGVASASPQVAPVPPSPSRLQADGLRGKRERLRGLE
jgi:flagellar protein FliO/FliZ